MARFNITNNGLPPVLDWAVGQKNRIEAKKQQDKAEWNEMMRQGMLAGWLLGQNKGTPEIPTSAEGSFNNMQRDFNRIDNSSVGDLRHNALGTDLDLYLLMKGAKNG